jgi:hypothetical protein
MRVRRFVTLILLVVWVLLGPLSMTYIGCAGMGAMCGSPCALPSCLLTPLPNLSELPLMSYVSAFRPRRPLTIFLQIPDPPPKAQALMA